MDVNNWVRILSSSALGPRDKMTCRDRDLQHQAWCAQAHQREQTKCMRAQRKEGTVGWGHSSDQGRLPVGGSIN